MKYANFTDPQFLDANGTGGLNFAFQSENASMASIGDAVWAAPGLLAPDEILIELGFLVITLVFSPDSGLVESGGTVVHAHGAQTGQDSQIYNVDLSSFVPGSGSSTVILSATPLVIQQDPFPIPGPPPGFPSFNPNFVPAVGYASNTYSFFIAVGTTPPDNVNSFEILRTTLTTGQTSITTYDTSHQVRACLRTAQPVITLTSGMDIVPSQAFNVISPSAGGFTFTLPPSVQSGGLSFTFVNPTGGNLTLAGSFTDVINGYNLSNASSITLYPFQTVVLWTAGKGSWEAIGGGGVQINRANPGYRVYPGGSIRQFGNVTVNANSTLSVNYATSFLAGPDVCGATIGGVGVTAGLLAVNMNVRNSGASNNNCTLSNPNSFPVAVDWWVDGL